MSRNKTGYEVEDASPKEVILAGAGLVVATFLVCLLMWGLFNILKQNVNSEPRSNPLSQSSQWPTEPRIQVDPSVELQSLRRHEDELLNSYSWADRKAGKVRIPVDRAMDMLLQRGGSNAPAR